jgi:peptide chain release factor 2
LEKKQKRLQELDQKMENPSFWNEKEKSQAIIDERVEIKNWYDPYKELASEFHQIKQLVLDAEAINDGALLLELALELEKIDKQLSALEVKRMLSHPSDVKNCYLTINAGAGGTEACDWALMLARMYRRWAERRHWKVEVIDTVAGEVAGIKSITYKFTGSYAYGYAQAERGVHRLVRISPFDSSGRRHTSFASVDVTPEITDDIVIDIKPADLRVDTFRSSGAGGQHVNVTDSAVRMTHLPTSIVVTCQSERSQIQNRESCMKMLKSKLYQREIEKRESSLKAISGEKKEIAFGSQIRSYVFQPYMLVKDGRTGYETGNITAMMDGELLDDFIIAYLKEKG